MAAAGSVSLGQIAELVGGECRGAASTRIVALASLREAGPGDLSFLFNSSYRRFLPECRAEAVLLRPRDAADCTLPCILVPDPRLAWARLSSLFDPAPGPRPGIHPTAVVDPGAICGSDVEIGAGAVIEADAVIGDAAVIGSGCHIGMRSRIGQGSKLYANVSVYHDVSIGARAIIHSGAVIGADGFGFAFDSTAYRMVKIHQVYGVRIGDDVEIGAGTTIDRGALNHTTIGDGVKLDNQVQVGHGTSVGAHTVISGRTAIAGSTRIGGYCLIGGAVGIIDNIEVCDRVEITAMSLVSQSITEPGRYSSGTGLLPSAVWKRSIVGFKRLGGMIQQINRLEAKVRALGGNSDE